MALKNAFRLSVLLFSTLCCLFTLPTEVSAATPLKDPLPEFMVPNLKPAGRPLKNSDLKGQVALLNIWASWCGYCRSEHPILMKIKDNYNVPIYGLNYKDDAKDALGFLEKNGDPYITVGDDNQGEIGDKLGTNGTPETYVIDKKGMIRHRHVGKLDEAEWKGTLWPLILKLQKES